MHLSVEADGRPRIAAVVHLAGFLALLFLAFSLPYEIERPALVVGSFRVTNLEGALLLTLLLGGAAIFLDRPSQRSAPPRIRMSWLILLSLFVTGLFVSGAMATGDKLVALKATVRSLGGLSLIFVIPQIVDRDRLKWIPATLLIGSLISVSAGFVEIFTGRALAWLDPFRDRPTVAGPFIRLTGSFNHANQTAMFIEAVVPLLLVLAWLAWRRRLRWLALLLAGALIFMLESLVLTYSRAGFATLFLSASLIVGLMLLRRPLDLTRAYPWAAVAGSVIILVAANSWLDPVLRLRLSSEGDNEWYDARLDVPDHIDMTAGQTRDVTLTITNEGALVWSSDAFPPVNIGARWYREADDRRSETELRWSLDAPVAPGKTLAMTLPVEAPASPGEYQLEWDLVQENVIWFSLKNGRETRSLVTVTGRPAAAAMITTDSFTQARSDQQPIPGRRTLWRVASQQFLERPLIGVGLDNFRLTYGQYLGSEAWNKTIHANNWYVETLVSLGMFGGLPFLAWLVLLGMDILLTLRYRRITLWTMALGAGLIAYLVHGLLDYFLLFNGTGLLFWLLVGLWLVERAPFENNLGSSLHAQQSAA